MPQRSNTQSTAQTNVQISSKILPGTLLSTHSRFTDTADVTALLGAFCFFLSSIEYMLPKPLPFMRLGIANLPILLAVDILPFPWYILLAIVKVIGMSLISGTLFSFVALFSLMGTLTAALVMWGARKLGGKYISQIGVSVLGAISSNLVQMVIARYVAFGEAAWLIAPVFVAMGLITGLALGLFAEHFAKVSRWYALASGRILAAPDTPSDNPGAAPPPAAQPTSRHQRRPHTEHHQARHQRRTAKKNAARAARQLRRARFEQTFVPWQIGLAGLTVAILFILERNLAVKLGLLLFFILATYLAGKSFSLLVTLMVSAGIILANLFVPSGKVLYQLGPLTVTQFALTDGIIKAMTFEGLMFLSKASILQGLKIPGTLGNIVSSSFLYYDRIIEYKGRIHAATLSADVDEMMFTVWQKETAQQEPTTSASVVSGLSPSSKTKQGAAILLLAVAIVVALFIFV
ncbi:MAG TPA: Gx transporter family protein [Spirochaetales bacterium]|nr:Gx transporter family protein [Spirochaetales bacterium]HPS15156.1 Gx transporter family protein [Spirochaetales bacterium]